MTKEVRVTAKVRGSNGFYQVTQYTDGSFWCTCPSFKFQRKPVEERACKHTRAFLQESLTFAKQPLERKEAA
jgi:uncharacterized Zn finger protein